MNRLVLIILVLVSCAGFSAPAFGAQDPPYRIGGDVKPPTKIKDVAPVYPAEAQRAGVSGVVIIEAVVGEDGRVRTTRVLRSIPLLDQAAINAVQQWEYTPTVINGAAVPIVMTVTVNFSAQGPAAAVPALPPPPPNTLRLLVTRGANGQMQAWEIDVRKAATLPSWSPDSEPPISPGEATRLARNWLSAHEPDASRFVLLSVSLQRRPLPMEAEFWFYQIAYFTAPSAPPGVARQMVLLLDGSILEPRVVPAAAVQQQPDPRSLPMPPGVTPPRAIREVRPSYTPEALRQKISGSVFIQGTVGVDGAFHDLRIVRSLDAIFGLDDAALRAASQWLFVPGMKDGQSVAVPMTIELTFSVR